MPTQEEMEARARTMMAQHKPAAWGEPGTLDPARVPNPYVHPGLGIAIERPEGWVWLPETSAPDFATHTDTAIRRLADPAEWHAPFEAPLIAMASSAEAVDGQDARVQLEVAPVTGPVAAVGAVLEHLDETLALRIRRPSWRPDYEVVQEPTAAPLAELEGSVARIRYSVGAEGDAPAMIEETIWLAPRLPYLMTLRTRVPVGDAEMQAAADEAVQSLTFEAGDVR